MPSNRAPARPNVDSIGEAAVSPADGTVWTTGGGFSSIPANARPSYQNTAVEKYLATAKNLPTGLFNASGRAVRAGAVLVGVAVASALTAYACVSVRLCPVPSWVVLLSVSGRGHGRVQLSDPSWRPHLAPG